MGRYIAWAPVWVLITGAALAQAAGALAQSGDISGTHAAIGADIPTSGKATLPPLPGGKSTIFGGAIRDVDPVRDQFLLDIYGEHPMKILFDERTEVYRDGVKVPVHDLGSVKHASVQTTLDGTHIFAKSIHILSQLPQGDYRGRVMRYNAATGQLELDASPAPPLTVMVTRNASFVRKGQSAFTGQGSGPGDLRPGALVEVTFAGGQGPHAIATQIVVLAVPGVSFVFSGNLTALDTARGTLVLVDPRDQASYQIIFSPFRINSRNLHVGQRVRVVASFNGSDYEASDVAAY
jgi:hypothetical protein